MVNSIIIMTNVVSFPKTQPPTVRQIIEVLSKQPSDARVCFYSDPETAGDFYITDVYYNKEKQRVLFAGDDCSDAQDADEIDSLL